MKKNILIAQSGGPTSAINATLSGVILEGIRNDTIGMVYGALNGIQGIMDNRIIRLDNQLLDDSDFRHLECTPAMALGSCRYRLPQYDIAPDIYKLIAQTMQNLDIGYFFYIGGNDSMDTAQKLFTYFNENNIDIKVIGIPKTIDNDLVLTDHTPGFGSAAKYIATSMLEIIRDAQVYDMQSVLIVEIMGRNAGWLTASSVLPRTMGNSAPHLIYLPEVPFHLDQFIKDVKAEQQHYNAVVIAVSEGLKLADGRYVAEEEINQSVDAFGHKHLSGVGQYLEHYIHDKLGCKVRSVELSVLQRCAAHLLSGTDIAQSRQIGSSAVKAALAGENGKMMAYKRISDRPYIVDIETVDLALVANAEKPFPADWITPNGHDVTDAAIDYLLPLIADEVSYPTFNGMPVHFQFDKTPIA